VVVLSTGARVAGMLLRASGTNGLLHHHTTPSSI
jgi:hypothetical protein